MSGGIFLHRKMFSPERMRKSHLPGTRRNTNFASQTKRNGLRNTSLQVTNH